MKKATSFSNADVKGTVMQIEKALINNDHLGISKVS